MEVVSGPEFVKRLVLSAIPGDGLKGNLPVAVRMDGLAGLVTAVQVINGQIWIDAEWPNMEAST